MNVSALVCAPADLQADGLVLGIFEGESAPAGIGAELDGALGGLLSGVLAGGDFKAKANQSLVLHAPQAKIKRLALVGLGKPGELTLEGVRQAAGKGATTLRELGVKVITVGVALDAARGWKAGAPGLEARALGQAVTEGAGMALYQMTEYRTRERDEIRVVDTIVPWHTSDAAPFQEGVEAGRVIVEAITLARTLISHPSNVVTATRLADEAVQACEAAGVAVRVYEKAELEEMQMGGILAVNQGSIHPPKLIVMEYTGGTPGERPIAIVGKGITFDTGGISLKPGEGMEKMKYDMAGGAATIAIITAAARLGIKKNIVAIVPATDNMPSATAFKPGDIFTAYNGLTVEVLNTDAEGRLVLCDAIAYAVKDKQACAVIDMATLTGACIIALGTEAFAVLGNHQGLIDQVLASGEHTGDRGWQLPLWKEYAELLRSDIADLKNIGGREAGTITAACFLQRFVGDTPWVHLDIAGTAWTEKESPYRPKGPTGAPVRAVLDVLEHWPAL
ncbi:MAG: leucyl aminopeptidase [Candidatus Sericytochromatia bacterium]|nr:leucyl aminopeptidase [Candidatus Sericytochromatia bacterium]